MQIISYNVNGLRSVERRGFTNWAQQVNPDFLCLQEIKMQENQLTESLKNITGFTSYFNCAEKKGYSGVAIYAKNQPLKVTRELGLDRFDQEGRMLQLEYPDFTLINIYLPHGGRLKENLEYKLECYKLLREHLQEMQSKPTILVGDLNVAHTELDLARAKQNQQNIMFTVEERQSLTDLLAVGFVDSFRSLHPLEQQYTWWPWLASARANNIGWRIDYGLVSQDLAPRVEKAEILREVAGSDHCPITIILSLNP